MIRRPLINRAIDALLLLSELTDLDYVVIDTWLFSKSMVRGEASRAALRAIQRRDLQREASSGLAGGHAPVVPSISAHIKLAREQLGG